MWGIYGLACTIIGELLWCIVWVFNQSHKSIKWNYLVILLFELWIQIKSLHKVEKFVKGATGLQCIHDLDNATQSCSQNLPLKSSFFKNTLRNKVAV